MDPHARALPLYRPPWHKRLRTSPLYANFSACFLIAVMLFFMVCMNYAFYVFLSNITPPLISWFENKFFSLSALLATLLAVGRFVGELLLGVVRFCFEGLKKYVLAAGALLLAAWTSFLPKPSQLPVLATTSAWVILRTSFLTYLDLFLRLSIAITYHSLYYLTTTLVAPTILFLSEALMTFFSVQTFILFHAYTIIKTSILLIADYSFIGFFLHQVFAIYLFVAEYFQPGRREKRRQLWVQQQREQEARWNERVEAVRARHAELSERQRRREEYADNYDAMYLRVI